MPKGWRSGAYVENAEILRLRNMIRKRIVLLRSG